MRLIGAVVAAAAIAAAGLGIAPAASGSPLTCDHRGTEHIKRHGGKLADDYYHISRHEPVTCDPDSKDEGIEDRAPREEHGDLDIPRRDHPGFHCTWHGCG